MKVCARDLFARLSREMELILGHAARIEDFVCNSAADGARDPDALRGAQHVDHLRQHVEALRLMFGALAKAEHGPQAIDLSAALDQVTLGGMRQRLSGAESQPSRPGDLELF